MSNETRVESAGRSNDFRMAGKAGSRMSIDMAAIPLKPASAYTK